jgi:hypothetical protein
MMKKFFLIIAIILSLPAHAGPDWSAIDDARKEKHEQKQAEVTQQTAHESALQKLQEACAKVQGNAELVSACKAIIEADQEAQAVK